METLSLLGLTIGFTTWLFFTSVVSSVFTPVQPSPSFEPDHVDSKADLSPSSPISSPSSSTLPDESFESRNQDAEKKKKKLDK